MKTLQMNQKADYGNWVPAAMMKTLWTATAAIAIVTVLMFVLIKSPVPGVIGIVVTLAALLPSKTDYYYYCHSGSGETFFAKTNDMHVANMRRAGLT